VNASLDSLFAGEHDDAKIDGVLAAMARGSKNGAVMVHCALGRDRTGMVVAMHRVLNEGWTPQHAYDEWHAHGFDASELRKIEFEALYRYFIGRVCPNAAADGCVARA
jgi:protein tyrosine/serine phosphatase